MCLIALHASHAQAGKGCETPVAERKSPLGCYLVAIHPLGRLPAGELFWHIYSYPTIAGANAEKTSRSSVAQSHDSVWLYTIAEKSWRPTMGERRALIGPLDHSPDVAYTARYMEGTVPPGARTPVHVHAGSEAWYVLEGAQCLETPDGITVVRAGESALVRQGPEMMLSSVGTATRRTLILVLHDASQPWTVENTPWKPKGLCPP